MLWYLMQPLTMLGAAGLLLWEGPRVAVITASWGTAWKLTFKRHGLRSSQSQVLCQGHGLHYSGCGTQRDTLICLTPFWRDSICVIRMGLRQQTHRKKRQGWLKEAERLFNPKKTRSNNQWMFAEVMTFKQDYWAISQIIVRMGNWRFQRESFIREKLLLCLAVFILYDYPAFSSTSNEGHYFGQRDRGRLLFVDGTKKLHLLDY